MGLYQNVNEDVNGNVFVNLQDGTGTGITSTTVSGKQALDVNVADSIMIGEPDQSAYTYGTSDFQPVGGTYNDTGATLTSGQAGSFRLTAERGLHINIRKSDGSELAASNATGLWVKPGDGTNAQAYSATSEAFTQLRQGGNVANVNASNQLLVLDGNAGSILGLMKPATATMSQVSLTASSQTGLASNANRKGATFVNDSNKTIWLAFGATASSSAYTYKVQPNGMVELFGNRVYTGVVSVIGAASISGSLVVTELT